MEIKTFSGTNGERDGLESKRPYFSENEMWKAKKEHTEMVVTVPIKCKYAKCSFAYKSLNIICFTKLLPI